MTLVRRESLAEQAADLLLGRIRDSEWEIGDKLPGETTLAPQLGVGRSTAREAIRSLAARGVLTTRQGAGVFVAATDAQENWTEVVGRSDIDAVIDARTAVEVEAAALAAHRHSSADIARLRDALAERAQTQDDVAAHVAADMAFHRGIVLAARSPILLDLFDAFAPRSRQAMIAMLERRGHFGEQSDHDVHARICDTIAAADSDSAAALTRAHLHALRAALD